MKLIVVAAVLLVLGAFSTASRAQSIDFSITDGTNTVKGALKGQLDISTGAFTVDDIVITSAPAGLTTPFDFGTTNGHIYGQSFTIADGQVTSASLEADGGFDVNSGQFLALDLNNPAANNINDLQLYETGPIGSFVGVVGPSGFAGADYTFIDAPEPSTWALMAGAAGLLVLCGFRPRRVVS